MSKCIMLIRHAEKPRAGRDGVNQAGWPDEGSLSVTGWQRAGALARYFGSGHPHESGIQRPQHIFAARPTALHPSTRPTDTVRPLAEVLRIAVDERWSDENPVERVGEVLRNFEAPVLVCWRHDGLPALARAIVRGPRVPDQWPDGRFDVTWTIRLHRDGWEFTQVPQRLLAGDATEGL